MFTFAQWVARLSRGYFKATGKKPDGLIKLKIKMEAAQKVKDQSKVVPFKYKKPFKQEIDEIKPKTAEDFIKKDDWDPSGMASGGIAGQLHLNEGGRIGFKKGKDVETFPQVGVTDPTGKSPTTGFSIGFNEILDDVMRNKPRSHISEKDLEQIYHSPEEGLENLMFRIFREDPEKLLRLYLGVGPKGTEIGIKKRFAQGGRILQASSGLAQVSRPGLQRGGPPGGGDPEMTYTAPSRRDPRPGGGDPGMTYTRPIPSPIINREVQGPQLFEPVPDKKVADDNLSKFMVNQKIDALMLMKAEKDKVWNTAERILQAFNVDEQTYNAALGHIEMSGVTTEHGATQELKKYLTAKGYDFSKLPAGTFMGGELQTTVGPATVGAEIIDDKLKAKAALSFENKAPKSTSGIGGLTGYGPSEWKKSIFDKLTKDVTGKVVYADKDLEGKLAFNKGIFGTGIDLSDSSWDAFLQSEDEKNKLGFTGIGPKVEGVAGKIGPFTGEYDLDTDAWRTKLNYPITDNISFKSAYDSDDTWDAGIYGKWTWGPKPKITEHRYESPTETEKFLRLNLNKLKKSLNAKGGRVGMGKGGLAKILGV